MKLHSLKIEQLRQFRAPFELTGLESGLNLFTGPNEAGKSTVVRAIRAAFFERHRSSSVNDLLPWGDSSATPTVEIVFEVGAQQLNLRKSFLNKKRCELVVDSRRLDGEDAEHHLAEMLGFEFPGKGASKPEHWGIPGLLWIEQGTGQEIGAPVGNATDHLRKALDQSVGEVASSQGDDVMATVRELRNELLTAAGRPRAAYAVAIADREGLALRMADLDLRITQYRQQVDQLGGLLEEDAEDQKTKPWETFRSQQLQAESRVAAIEVLKGQLAADGGALAQGKEKQVLIEEQIQSFDSQHRDLKAREQTLIDLDEQLLTQKGSCESWAIAGREADVAYRAASEALVAARQENLREDIARRLADATSRVGIVSKVVSNAETEQRHLADFQQLARETVLTKGDIVKLRDQQAKLTELRIRQEVAATRLRFQLDPGVTVALAGQPMTGQGEQLITADTSLHIAGVGQFQITPGGTDLPDLAREEAALRTEHQALLQRLGIATLADAEVRFASYQQAVLDIKHSEKALSHLAPDGLDALRTELAGIQSRQTEAQGLMDQLPPISELPAAPLQEATRDQAAASAHLETVRMQSSEAQMALVTAQTQRDGALRERDALLALLGTPERQERLREVNQSLLNVRAEGQALTTRIQTRKQEVEAALPDILAQDAERFRRSAEQSDRTFRERRTNIMVIRGKLEEAGAQGLEETHAELAVRADAAGRRVAELKLRAEALDLLVELLEDKRQALTKRLQAPLQKHIQRYLQLLFPQATLDISEDLTPGQLTRVGSRGTESGHFNDMSFGAREQMGVISRLAYADLLKEAGRPTLIILDDALVHSDEHRLEQMKRILFDASQRHQVLLFTCHPGSWRGLGSSPRLIGLG